MVERFFKSYYPKFEQIVITILAVSIMIAILYATVIFISVMAVTIIDLQPFKTLMATLDQSHTIATPIAKLQSGLFQIFGGFLLILLGLELIGTVRTFSQENHIKLESIIAIAIIASSRHLITLDYHHTNPIVIFAAGFVVLVLIIGYFLLKLNTAKTNKAA